MTEVILGSNRFSGCTALVAIQQHELLRVSSSPLSVSLTTPPTLPSGKSVQVVNNEPQPGSPLSVRIVASDKSVAIFWDEAPLVIATLLPDDLVSLRVDLRPIGINLFDDADGLHVGDNRFKGNQISGASTAIVLG